MRLAVVLVVLLLSSAVSLSACECSKDTFSQGLAEGDTIIVGTLQDLSPGPSPYVSSITVKVLRTYRGLGVDVITFLSPAAGGGSCGAYLAEGKEYLIIARSKGINQCSVFLLDSLSPKQRQALEALAPK